MSLKLPQCKYPPPIWQNRYFSDCDTVWKAGIQ